MIIYRESPLQQAWLYKWPDPGIGLHDNILHKEVALYRFARFGDKGIKLSGDTLELLPN
jgi:hypothetical protein